MAHCFECGGLAKKKEETCFSCDGTGKLKAKVEKPKKGFFKK